MLKQIPRDIGARTKISTKTGLCVNNEDLGKISHFSYIFDGITIEAVFVL